MALNGKQIRHLRALGHHLKPVVRVGQSGASEALIAKTNEELEAHELIKLKLGDGCLDDLTTVGVVVADGCKAEVVQKIGKTLLLYRRRKEDPTIELPR